MDRLNMEQLTIIEQKINIKKNLISRLEQINKKIINVYVTEYPNGKPLLYPLPQEIMLVYKTNEKAIKKLKEEIEQQSANI